MNYQYQTKAFCYSPDKTKIYMSSLYFNELAVYDCESGCIEKRLFIEDEDDCAELFAGIVWCNNRLLLIPRKAKNYHVIDIFDLSQTTIGPKKFSDDFVPNSLGAFAYAKENSVFLINRRPARIFVIRMDSLTVTEIDIPNKKKRKIALECYVVGTLLYVYCGYDELRIILNTESLNVEVLQIPKVEKSLSKKVWNNTLYVVKTGNVLEKYDLALNLLSQRDLKHSGILVETGGRLYVYSNNGEYFTDVENDASVKIECQERVKSVTPTIYNLNMDSFSIEEIEDSDVDRVFRYRFVSHLEAGIHIKTEAILNDVDTILFRENFCRMMAGKQEVIYEDALINVSDFISTLN